MPRVQQAGEGQTNAPRMLQDRCSVPRGCSKIAVQRPEDAPRSLFSAPTRMLQGRRSVPRVLLPLPSAGEGLGEGWYGKAPQQTKP